jgi:hypothetical protein
MERSICTRFCQQSRGQFNRFPRQKAEDETLNSRREMAGRQRVRPVEFPAQSGCGRTGCSDAVLFAVFDRRPGGDHDFMSGIAPDEVIRAVREFAGGCGMHIACDRAARLYALIINVDVSPSPKKRPFHLTADGMTDAAATAPTIGFLRFLPAAHPKA